VVRYCYMREHSFANGEFYHIFNRGVDKRNIFLDKADFTRFLQGMDVFNSVEPVGSLWEQSFVKRHGGPARKSSQLTRSKLVHIIAYCLNPNHFHFLLEQLVDGGVSAFVHRAGGGFSKYFNIKYKRSGTLFEGKFKSVPIISNEQLLHVSVYVNLNDRAHELHRGTSLSSWREYVGDVDENLCKKNIILRQFRGVSEYEGFAKSSLRDILGYKRGLKEFQKLFLE